MRHVCGRVEILLQERHTEIASQCTRAKAEAGVEVGARARASQGRVIEQLGGPSARARDSTRESNRKRKEGEEEKKRETTHPLCGATKERANDMTKDQKSQGECGFEEMPHIAVVGFKEGW